MSRRPQAPGVDEYTARTLVTAGAVRGARVVAQGDRWTVELQSGQAGEWVPVVASRGHVREWRTADTVIGWLRDLGVAQFSLDARAFSSDQKSVI